MKKFLVHRILEKGDCEVMVVKDRKSGLFCFVNLTHPHVCSCRFSSIEDAVEDMKQRKDVISFEEID